MGRNFIINGETPIWWYLGRIVQTENIGSVRPGDPSEENRTWLSQIENNGKKEVSSKTSRNRNFRTRNGNYERNSVVKNQETKQRGQRILGDCWQWEANGQCSRGDNCSFRHDINKRAQIDTPESISEFFHATEWEKCVENPKSQRKKFQW